MRTLLVWERWQDTDVGSRRVVLFGCPNTDAKH